VRRQIAGRNKNECAQKKASRLFLLPLVMFARTSPAAPRLSGEVVSAWCDWRTTSC
jgi:hypothetical protein